METFASTDSSAVSNNFSFYRVLNSVFAFLYIHGISDFSLDFHQWLFHYQSSCSECFILSSLHKSLSKKKATNSRQEKSARRSNYRSDGGSSYASFNVFC